MTKLAIILGLVFTIPSFANSYGQKISLQLDNVSLKDALKAIENQDYYRFVYQSRIITKDQKVTIHVTDAQLNDVLGILLQNSSLGYKKVNDKLVVILDANTIKEIANIGIGITGKVTDADGKPLHGVSIMEKGTNNGTSTRDDGSFMLTVTGDNSVLLFSIVGYSPKEIPVKKNTVLTVALEASNKELEQVVVIGYGSQRKADVTSAVASVKSENFVKGPVLDAGQLIQGKVAGLTVSSSSGDPTSGSQILLRGNTTLFGANTDPLVLVDGIPSSLKTVAPEDIESIDVLKDASATAIYGSNGANGVVIITTKRGRKGSTEISYSNNLGSQTVSKKLSLLNASQWGALVNDINRSDGKPITYSDSALAALGVGSDWQSAALRKAFQQNHELSISGGDEKSRFLISGNYYDQDGIILNSGFKRFSGRINYERNVTSKFKISTNIFGSRAKVNAPFGNANINNSSSQPGGGFSSILFTSPAAPIKNGDGTYNTSNALLSSTNPIQDLVSTINQTTVTRLLANVAGEYKFTKDLTLKVTAGVDLLNSKQNYYSPTYAGSPAGASGTGYSVSGYAGVGSAAATIWLNENTLTYEHAFNKKHFLTALAGYTTKSEHGESAVASAQKFSNNITTYNNLASAGTANLPTSGSRDQVQNSFLARVSYSYLHKYNVTISERADGASQLGENNKWGYFPSVGLSWNVDKEDFFKHVDNTINSLKLRVTAGQTGNSNIPPYSSLPSLTPTNYYFGSPQTLATGLSPNQLGNPDLKWETTTQYNAGVDVGLLHNRINFSFDAYYKKTTDLLLNVPLPLYTGYATKLENIGSVENKGIELALNTQNIVTKKFLWSSTIVFGLNRNKVLALEPGVNSYFPTAPIGLVSPVIVKVGLPVGAFWGYSTDGLLTKADIDKGVPLLSGVSQTVGDRKYLPLKEGTTVITSADKHYLGSAQPKFTASFSNTLNYGGFDLSFLLQGSYGNKLFNQLAQNLERPTLTTNGPSTQLDRYNASNPNGTMPRATNAPVTQVTDRYIEDASYIRLKNISLGYSFPISVLSKLHATQLRLFISAQNLFTITKYTGYDPEANYYDADNTKAGIDYGIYPSSKTFLGGLKVTF